MGPQSRFDPVEVERYEKAAWSRCAQSYDGFSVLTGEAIEPLLDAAGVRSGSRVLDVGTGTGLVVNRVMKRGGSAVGIDFSEPMLGEARERNPTAEFRQASADALPFQNASFDAVVSNFVVHHMGQPQKALQEAFRVLRNSGRLAFTVWGELSKLEAFGLFFAAVGEHSAATELPNGPLFGVTDFSVLRAMVSDVGFKEINVRDLPLRWEMSSIDSLLKAFRDWANLDLLSEAVQAGIETSMREKARAYRRENVFSIPNPAILVSATK